MPKFLAQVPVVVIFHAKSKNSSHLSFGAPNPMRRASCAAHREKKPVFVTKKFPCDQNCPKLLEIWAGGSLRGTMLGHRSFNQDSKLILLFFLFCCSTQFGLQAPYLGLCTHVPCLVMISHPPQYGLVSFFLLQQSLQVDIDML